MDRVQRFKFILWMLVGLGAAVASARYLFGLGATTNLSDAVPWGIWIGFDVMSGVALAAGGFVIAATVYIFKLDKYHAAVRPAVLTALLGYIAVAVGLLFDLGLPWNIWHMIIYWNVHSPLFEVGWCVMLYLTVLLLEFFPVPAEDVGWLAGIRRVLVKLRLPLVITGIALSTLHQSSLGSLFLIMPDNLHPLWYSPLLPVMFFVSAVGLGLLMVTLESLVSSWLYRKEPEFDLLAGLTGAARWVILGYLALRFGDMAVRGQLIHLADPGWQPGMFWAELGLMGVIPLALLFIPGLRRTRAGLWTVALVGVTGVVLNRINVGGLAHLGRGEVLYLPAWTEIAISAAVVAAAVLVFLYMIEHFRVWEHRPINPEAEPAGAPVFHPLDRTWLGAPTAAARTKYSLGFIIAAALGFMFLSDKPASSHGISPDRALQARGQDTLWIDGNHDGFGTMFPHKAHEESIRKVWTAAESRPPEEFIGGDAHPPLSVSQEDGSPHPSQTTEVSGSNPDDRRGRLSYDCVACHHMNLPGDRNSACSACHGMMYLPTDAFKHDWHASPKGARLACHTCHEAGLAKTAATAVQCAECHKDLVPAGATIIVENYDAPGYVEAMHRLCQGCHARAAGQLEKPELGRCTACHEERRLLADRRGEGAPSDMAVNPVLPPIEER